MPDLLATSWSKTSDCVVFMLLLGLLTCKNRLPYTVLAGTLNHAQSNVLAFMPCYYFSDGNYYEIHIGLLCNMCWPFVYPLNYCCYKHFSD